MLVFEHCGLLLEAGSRQPGQHARTHARRTWTEVVELHSLWFQPIGVGRQTILADNRNGERLRLNATHPDDDDDEQLYSNDCTKAVCVCVF